MGNPILEAKKSPFKNVNVKKFLLLKEAVVKSVLLLIKKMGVILIYIHKFTKSLVFVCKPIFPLSKNKCRTSSAHQGYTVIGRAD